MKRVLWRPALLAVCILVVIAASGFLLRGNTGSDQKPQPSKADELRRRLHAWRESVGAQMPTRNPGYDPAKPQHIAGNKLDGE